MKKLILIILLLPLLACSQTKVKDIQTVKIANDSTTFGKLLPSGTLVLDVSTSKTYYLIAAANADKTIISSGAKTTDPTGLELITESVNDGWRLIGADPANYGDIGDDAVDLSINNSASSTRGATGDYAFATGEATKASGMNSFASGVITEASASYSTAMGKETVASGEGSFASGEATTASNYYSTAMGYTTVASGSSSFATGNETTASGTSSFSMGEETVAQNTNQLSIGQYNIGTSSSTIFEAGIGTGVTAKNAFEIHTDGKVWADHLQVDGNIKLGGHIILGSPVGIDTNNYKLIIDDNAIFNDNLTITDTLFTNIIHTSDAEYLNLSGPIYKTGGNGDLNNNGTISATDALVVTYMVTTNNDVSDVLGYGTYQDLWARGDVDGDGTVSYLEKVIVQMMVGGGFFTYDSLRLMSRKLNSRAFTIQNHTGLSATNDTWEDVFDMFVSHVGTGVSEETTLSVDNDGNTAIKAVIDTNYSLLVSGNIGITNTGNSIFIGENAGIVDDLTTNKNVFIGYLSGALNTTGAYNIAIGSQSFYNNISGLSNTVVGTSALTDNETGNSNSAFGSGALSQNTAGDYNTGIGAQAGYANSIGNNNVSIGYRALYSNIYSNNTTIGYKAGYNNNGSNNIFIGYEAGFNEADSNTLYIENSNSTTPLIYGDFAADSLVINGDLTVTGKVTFSNNNVPNNATATGTLGEIVYGEDYIYICTATDTWKRVAIATW